MEIGKHFVYNRIRENAGNFEPYRFHMRFQKKKQYKMQLVVSFWGRDEIVQGKYKGTFPDRTGGVLPGGESAGAVG